jgi:hypothetical protein
LIGYFGDYKTGEWSNQALHTIAKNAYRLRAVGEPGGRIRYRARREIVYARTEAERRRWLLADKAMIVAQLDRTEERVMRIMNSGSQTDIVAKIKELRQKAPEEDDEGGQP